MKTTMETNNEVPMPEVQESTNWNIFMDKVTGYSEWVEKYKKQHYEQRTNKKH